MLTQHSRYQALPFEMKTTNIFFSFFMILFCDFKSYLTRLHRYLMVERKAGDWLLQTAHILWLYYKILIRSLILAREKAARGSTILFKIVQLSQNGRGNNRFPWWKCAHLHCLSNGTLLDTNHAMQRPEEAKNFKDADESKGNVFCAKKMNLHIQHCCMNS